MRFFAKILSKIVGTPGTYIEEMMRAFVLLCKGNLKWDFFWPFLASPGLNITQKLLMTAPFEFICRRTLKRGKRNSPRFLSPNLSIHCLMPLILQTYIMLGRSGFLQRRNFLSEFMRIFLCEGMNFVRGKYFGFPPLLKWSLLIIFLIWILTFQASAKSGTHSSIGRKGHSFLEPGSLKIFSSRETNTTWRLKRKLEKKIVAYKYYKKKIPTLYILQKTIEQLLPNFKKFS